MRGPNTPIARASGERKTNAITTERITGSTAGNQGTLGGSAGMGRAGGGPMFTGVVEHGAGVSEVFHPELGRRGPPLCLWTRAALASAA